MLDVMVQGLLKYNRKEFHLLHPPSLTFPSVRAQQDNSDTKTHRIDPFWTPRGHTNYFQAKKDQLPKPIRRCCAKLLDCFLFYIPFSLWSLLFLSPDFKCHRKTCQKKCAASHSSNQTRLFLPAYFSKLVFLFLFLSAHRPRQHPPRHVTCDSSRLGH